VILAICEAEIWRIMVQGQHRQKFDRPSSQPIAGYLSSQAVMEAEIWMNAFPKKFVRSYLNEKKWVW
jgi:hypothetical protein